MFSNTPLSAEEMGENKAFNVSVDGTEVYNRLNADKTNRTDTDPNPSTDGGKANAGGNWGPIVPKEGNDWWGTATPGKRKWYLHSIPLVYKYKYKTQTCYWQVTNIFSIVIFFFFLNWYIRHLSLYRHFFLESFIWIKYLKNINVLRYYLFRQLLLLKQQLMPRCKCNPYWFSQAKVEDKSTKKKAAEWKRWCINLFAPLLDNEFFRSSIIKTENKQPEPCLITFALFYSNWEKVEIW